MPTTTDAELPANLQHLSNTTSFFRGEYNAQSVTVTICCALAIASAFELLLLIFTTFRRYGGLYFWSLVVATTGILPYTFTVMIQYFHLTVQVVAQVLTTFGWPAMVTGQSVVLYSRLGIVLGPSYTNILKLVKWIIIVDGVVLHTTTQIVMYGAFNAHPNRTWAQAYKHVETVQMTIFTAQEFFISGLYIWRTVDILKSANPSRRPKRIMRQLFIINVIIVIMDIALLVVQYQNRHVLEQSLKAVVYSTKLKLEFAILNKLVNITQNSTNEVFLESLRDSSGTEVRQERHDSVYQERSDTLWPKALNKSEGEAPEHIERALSSAGADQIRTGLPPLRPVETMDQQQRRQVIEMDDYADACRSLAR